MGFKTEIFCARLRSKVDLKMGGVGGFKYVLSTGAFSSGACGYVHRVLEKNFAFCKSRGKPCQVFFEKTSIYFDFDH